MIWQTQIFTLHEDSSVFIWCYLESALFSYWPFSKLETLIWCFESDLASFYFYLHVCLLKLAWSIIKLQFLPSIRLESTQFAPSVIVRSSSKRMMEKMVCNYSWSNLLLVWALLQKINIYHIRIRDIADFSSNKVHVVVSNSNVVMR